MILPLLQMLPSFDTTNTEKAIESSNFFKVFSSWELFKEFIPVLITAVVVLVLFFLLANFLEKRLIKSIRKRTDGEQVLVANFFGKVLWILIFGIGIVAAMFILGLGEISGTLLGAAGLTTFVVGFALKDIFENFLAGVIIAFDPPFVLGSWVEIDGIQGIVREMSLRQTMLKSFDGQDVFIPNSIVLKNPLRNYTIDGFLRKEFVIGLDYGDDLHVGLDLIQKALAKTEFVLNIPGRLPEARVEEFATSAVNVKCLFWVNTEETSAPASKVVNQAMLNVLEVLVDAGHYLPADILEIKYYDPSAESKDKEDLLKKDLENLK